MPNKPTKQKTKSSTLSLVSGTAKKAPAPDAELVITNLLENTKQRWLQDSALSVRCCDCAGAELRR